MFEPHAPHHYIETWRGFFIHIATIVVGLIIAVGLEQTVEYFHHQHQRDYLAEQMHEVFEDDLNLVAYDTAHLNGFRSYLVELELAINARRRGQAAPAAPPGNDPRAVVFIRFPSLAPYEAAKDNGTVALLPNSRIRLYNRIALQRGLLVKLIDQWDDDLAAMNAFKKRFEPAAKTTGLAEFQSPPNLAVLSAAELTEYGALVANQINRTDYVVTRLQFFGAECRAVLDGVDDENTLIEALLRTTRAGSSELRAPAEGK